jgi:DNA-binding transcriptional regulator YiaG
MKTLQERAERVSQTIDVPIPSLDGTSVAYTVPVVVPALRDPVDGEIYLEGEAQEIIDRTKARYMGLISAPEIRGLREYLGVTQRSMSELLQMGAKTYTRWESGGDHPSRSLNILLRALRDGRIDVPYLRSIRPNLDGTVANWSHVWSNAPARQATESVPVKSTTVEPAIYETQPIAA